MLYLYVVGENKKNEFFDGTKYKVRDYKKTALRKTYDRDSAEFKAAVASFAYVYFMDKKVSDLPNLHCEEIINGNFRNKVNDEILEDFSEEIDIAKQVMKFADMDVDYMWSSNNEHICNMFKALFQSSVFMSNKVFVLYDEEHEDLLFEKIAKHNKKITKDDTIPLYDEQEAAQPDEDEDDDLTGMSFNSWVSDSVYGKFKVLPLDKGTAAFFKLSLNEEDMDKFCINI